MDFGEVEKDSETADLRFDSIENLNINFIYKETPKILKIESTDKKPELFNSIDTIPLKLPQAEKRGPIFNSADTLPINLKNIIPKPLKVEEDFDLIKKIGNPALEELLNFNGNNQVKKVQKFISADTVPLDLPFIQIKRPPPPPPPVKSELNKKEDSIEKLSFDELSFLSEKVDKSSGTGLVINKLNINAGPDGVEKQEPEERIETLSLNEMTLLAEKFANLPEIDFLNPDVNENKMTLVETFDGLKLSKVLPPQPVITDYKPNFVLSDTNHLKEHLPDLKEGKTFARKFDLYEAGMFLGIQVGKSNKIDVIRIMREYGSEIFKPKETDKNKSYFAKDLSLSVSFNTEGIVNELTLGSEFKNQTSKGLRIGDPLKKVIEIYGKAEVVTPISLNWGNFVIFHKHGIVTHIRVLEKK